MSLLWDRKVIVQVGQPGRPGRSWEGLKTTFTVKKGIGRKPNEATIEVYNLTRNSAAAFRESGAVVRLLAGYGVAETIFLGGVDRAETTRDGVDAVTRIEAADGGRQFRAARINKAFEGGTSLRTVLDELVAAAGLPKGSIGAIPDVQITQGVVLAGPVRDQLDRLAAILGAEWSIQDGELQLLTPDQHTGEESVLLSPDTGLVGSPKPHYEGQSKKPSGVEVLCLLQPKLRPGRRFKLEARDYRGVFKAREVEHTGDTHGSDFYTRVVAKEST